MKNDLTARVAKGLRALFGALFILCFAQEAAFANSAGYTAGSGTTFLLTDDGSGHVISMFGMCGSSTTTLPTTSANSSPCTGLVTIGSLGQVNVAASLTNAGATNPTSTLAMTSATTAYSAGQLVATNATAGSVVVPSFAIANTAGAVSIRSMLLTSNDSTSTAWGGASLQIDLWSAAPTFTNGDRAAYAVATGAAGYLGSFTCLMSPVAGDGVYSVCTPLFGGMAEAIKLASGTSIYWSMQALSATGVTAASRTWTLTPRLYN